jgi:DNA-binding transcriptional regulator YhcF (GntR family)
MDLRVDRDGEVPLGTQLAWKLRALIEAGELGAGARLPSVREAASAAGVNVNTVRTVYGRLERDGLVTTEQGRGTFVRPGAAPAPDAESAGDARRALRRQIARLESELARRPPPPTEAASAGRRPGPGGALLSAEQLEDVRDDLLGRLRTLDDARAEVMRRLDELPATDEPEVPEPARRRSPGPSSASLAGARVRWVGA